MVLISSQILITKKSKQINICTSEILPRNESNSSKNILISKQNYDNIIKLRCINNFINIFFSIRNGPKKHNQNLLSIYELFKIIQQTDKIKLSKDSKLK